MKRIGFILIAIVAIAFLIPALSTAQSTSIQTVNINGYVYSGALPVDGAKVQVYSWDGKNMGNAPLKTVTTSDGSNGITGSYVLKNVPYDPDKTFQYVVMASKDDRTAYALVHIVPPEAAGEYPKAEPIVMDLTMDSWVSDLTGTVQSGNLLQNAIGVTGANVSIYSRDETTGAISPMTTATSITDMNGKFEVKEIPYGLYQAVVTAVVNSANYKEKVNFTVYQQETHVNVIMTNVMLATPTPTPLPTKKPSGNSSGLFGMGIPGFEAILALAAIGGTALFFRKKL